MEDAFAHHVWATLRLVDSCLALSSQQLETTVPGTYGSILDTLRHCVGSDAWDLFVATGDRTSLIDEGDMELPELRAAMETHGPAWSRLLAQDLDPDTVLHEVDETDGYTRDVAMSIQLAGALQHGTDHRSQVCTALTALGIEPPHIDVINFGIQAGLVEEITPAS
ncbi:MAG: hypothetical protein QOI81_1716 [Actinomycetota bacterium]|nr:hypothetical protein [Actinomycetota bacterium]